MRNRQVITLDLIDDNPWQPRREMDEESLQELKSSIRQVGLLQLPLVRQVGERYQAAFGHRRIAACRLLARDGVQGEIWDWAGKNIEVEIAALTDEEMAVMALTENERRDDVPPLDMARAHRRVIDETELTLKELARKLGVARPTLNNHLRVLNLPQIVLDRVDSGEMSMSVAREFLPLICQESEHTGMMEQIIASCAARGVWTRFAVRDRITHHCFWGHDWRLLNGQNRQTMRDLPRFDVDAFAAEHKGCLHRLPDYSDESGDMSGSALATCNLEAWDDWQALAMAELKAVAAAERPLTMPEPSTSPNGWLAKSLAADPVWQGLAALRSEPGPDLPQNDREREALGTRATFVDAWYGLPFYKELRFQEIRHTYDVRNAEGEKGSGVPPWFPDLEECRSCVVGAQYTKMGYPEQPTLICTNRGHYMEKVKRGEKAYRERLQDARDVADEQDRDAMEELAVSMMDVPIETTQVLLQALVAANGVLAWRHALGFHDKRFSDEGEMAERIRMILGMDAAEYNLSDVRPRTIDPEAVKKLRQDDIERLLAALVVHRNRQAKGAFPEGWDEVPRGTQLEIPEEAYEPVGA